MEVVNLRFQEGSGGVLLRIDIDREGPDGVTLDDCRKFSLALEMALDDRDIIDRAYTLEVSSPGMDRPIQTDDDFRRNTGRKVSIEIDSDGDRRTVVGTLLGREGGKVRILTGEDTGEVMIPWTEVVHATQYLPY